MFNNKVLTTAAILLALLGFATAQMKAEIPIVQADTIFQGFGGGSVSGIVFGPSGETVIVMHDAQPVEIDIKTKQIVREFEKVPNYTSGGGHLVFLKEKGWLIDYARSTELNGIKKFVGQVFWDINTGKIIMAKQIQIILSDGIKCFSFITVNDKQYICKLDINTFKYTDSVEFEQGWYHGVQQRFSAGFGIIPNSNKVIIGANVSGTRAMLYVLDFDTKEYTEIPIPFESGQDSSTIYRIQVSETGKYFTVEISIPIDLAAILIYDGNYNFLKKITYAELNKKVNYPKERTNNWIPSFIHDDYLFAIGKYWSSELKDDFYSHDFYDIGSREIKKKVAFDRVIFVDYYGNDIALLTRDSKVGLLHLDALPVQENKINLIEKTAEFQNGKLILNSEFSEIADIDIIDYKGNNLYSIIGLNISQGRNSIPIDYPLSNGIYFLLLKSESGNLSYKFMVSQ